MADLLTTDDLTIAGARRVLHSCFGYDDFRAGQTLAVESVLAGRDTLVILPTGGGKSLCFQVPALMLPKLTVVISPLISLMKDQVDALTRRGLPAAFINSTLSPAQVSERMNAAAEGKLKLLYVAPERFDAGSTARQLKEIGVSLLAIDEAHCISQWGHDFRPSYLRVRDVRTQLGDPPTIALTATATPSVRQDISEQLALNDPRVIITGFDRTNLSYYVAPAKNDHEKDSRLVSILNDYEGLAVIYASTRKSVERIAGLLKTNKIRAAAYHAGLDDDRRQEVQESFMGESVRAIVATNAFGMGIDKPNVRLVIHHSMPGTLEAYYQEAGRAGRDGDHSNVFLLHSFPDRFTHEFFIKGSYPEEETVENVYWYLQRKAGPSGIVNQALDSIAAGIKNVKASARDVESALRVLEQGGAVSRELDSFTRVTVRLLATPERIRNELSGESDRGELQLLRRLWRSHGERLYSGVGVDLSLWPRSAGHPRDLIIMLEGLQARQFVVVERLGGGILLTNQAARLETFPIDWRTLNRRRSNDMAKLEAMQSYAYAKECRRTFVLRYFGDRTPREDKCSACDNCLGESHESVVRLRSTIAGKPERNGSSSHRTGTGSGTLSRSGSGTLSRSGAVTLARSSASSKSKPAFDADIDEATLSEDTLELLQALKDLRSEIAHADQVPAYIVFNNKTILQMALEKPKNASSLLQLRGVGPAKVEKYGDAFLQTIAKHL